MYLRLFIVRYLTNVSRKEPSEIASIMNSINTTGELKYLHASITNENFLHLIIQGMPFKNAVEVHHAMTKKVSGDLISFSDHFYLTLNAELHWCKNQLNLVTNGTDYATSPGALLGHIESNLRILKKMAAAIQKSQKLFTDAKIKMIEAKAKAEAEAKTTDFSN